MAIKIFHHQNTHSNPPGNWFWKKKVKKKTIVTAEVKSTYVCFLLYCRLKSKPEVSETEK